MQAGVVEPPDPSQCDGFEFVDGAPWLACFDQRSFEQSADCFGQGVVVGVSDGTGGSFDS